MSVFDRINQNAARKSPQRFSIDTWIQDYLIPSKQFQFGGNTYTTSGLKTTYSSGKMIEVTDTLPGYTEALRSCPPAFASQMVRAMVLSQARFIWRTQRSNSVGRKTFGNRDLKILERPWEGATTGDLIARMEWMAGVAGTAYVYDRRSGRTRELKVLRSDWVGVLYGSELEPDSSSGFAPDSRIIGYVYQEGGLRHDNKNQIYTILPDEMTRWAPIPDPERPGLGQSWITPAIREIQGDQIAIEHKLQFFKNGATPNLVVTGIPAVTGEAFQEIVDALEEQHTGLGNAYKTMYLVAGADAKVIGSDMSQMNFTDVIGRGETRISILSRVPAALLGISEGLRGSALNQGNFGMARRMFADTWVYPTLQDLASCLEPLLDVPDDSELWFDVRDIPLLREDAKDAAEIEQIKEATITAYIAAGFTPKSSVLATVSQDPTLLEHTGLVSVQLQPPGTPADANSEGKMPVETDTKVPKVPKPAPPPKKQRG